MSESFLEDQLKRMREMSEQMSRASNHAAELNDELARNREASQQGPLNQVRDFRTYSSISDCRSADAALKPRSESDAGNTRRHTARDSSRRRR
jgi:hypothetical protein